MHSSAIGHFASQRSFLFSSKENCRDFWERLYFFVLRRSTKHSKRHQAYNSQEWSYRITYSTRSVPPHSSSQQNLKTLLQTYHYKSSLVLSIAIKSIMSEQSTTTNANAPAEPVLCKMGCGFFVSVILIQNSGNRSFQRSLPAVLDWVRSMIWFHPIIQYGAMSLDRRRCGGKRRTDLYGRAQTANRSIEKTKEQSIQIKQSGCSKIHFMNIPLSLNSL